MYTIYALLDPRTKHIHYIGLTSGSLKVRYKNHLSSSLRGEKCPKAIWIRQLDVQGLKPDLKIIELTSDKGRERYWIARYRKNLLNVSLGGQWRIKDQCVKGHLLSEKNLKVTSDGVRVCVSCARNSSKAYQIRRRQKLKEQGLSCRGKLKQRQYCRSGKHLWNEQNWYVSPKGIKTCAVCQKEKYLKNSIKTGRKKPERTHCKYGHLFTEATRIKPKFGRTRCRICVEARETSS